MSEIAPAMPPQNQEGPVELAIAAREGALDEAARQAEYPVVVSEGGDQTRVLPGSAKMGPNGEVEIRSDENIGDAHLNSLGEPDTTISRSGGNGPNRSIGIAKTEQVEGSETKTTYDVEYKLGKLVTGAGIVQENSGVDKVDISRRDSDGNEYSHSIKSQENRDRIATIVARRAQRQVDASEKTPRRVIEERRIAA